MKAYLAVTGALFAVLAMMHLVRAISKWSLLQVDPWFVLGTGGIAVITGAMAIWAWRLFWRAPRTRIQRPP